MRKIILASESLSRKEILEKLGIRFEVERSGYEEDMTLKMKPERLVVHLSRGKAEAVAKRHKNAIVIAADTIVVHKGRVFGKARSRAQARTMMTAFSNSSHHALTGFTIIDTKSKHIISKVVKTKVYFRKLTKNEIERYIRTEEPYKGAGGYMIAQGAAVFLKRIEGDYLNIVGLPAAPLIEELKKFGV